jgi:hypothetical protein
MFNIFPNPTWHISSKWKKSDSSVFREQFGGDKKIYAYGTGWLYWRVF